MRWPWTLGIESSCDETAVALIDSDGRVVINLVASQVAAHAPYGGVVPELASREHMKLLPPIVKEVLKKAPAQPELVAATGGPGLVGSLLVGLRYAAAYAWARKLPFVAVDHLYGHVHAAFLNPHGEPADPMPEKFLALVASGGHSSWYLVEGGETKLLARTRDDAPGEVFDKVAQLLGLGYPGGPIVDRMASSGNPQRYRQLFTQPKIKDGSGDLSFAGFKAAVSRLVTVSGIRPRDEDLPDLLAAFQEAVVEHLLSPLQRLVRAHNPSLVVASGGVAANSKLRAELEARCLRMGVEPRLVPKALATDNAAMIARAGQFLWHEKGVEHDPRRVDAWTRRAWQPPGMRKRK